MACLTTGGRRHSSRRQRRGQLWQARRQNGFETRADEPVNFALDFTLPPVARNPRPGVCSSTSSDGERDGTATIRVAGRTSDASKGDMTLNRPDMEWNQLEHRSRRRQRQSLYGQLCAAAYLRRRRFSGTARRGEFQRARARHGAAGSAAASAATGSRASNTHHLRRRQPRLEKRVCVAAGGKSQEASHRRYQQDGLFQQFQSAQGHKGRGHRNTSRRDYMRAVFVQFGDKIPKP